MRFVGPGQLILVQSILGWKQSNNATIWGSIENKTHILFPSKQVDFTPSFTCKVEGFLVANAVVTGWKVCWACKPDQVLPLARISSVKVRVPEIFHPKTSSHGDESYKYPTNAPP